MTQLMETGTAFTPPAARNRDDDGAMRDPIASGGPFSRTVTRFSRYGETYTYPCHLQFNYEKLIFSSNQIYALVNKCQI